MLTCKQHLKGEKLLLLAKLLQLLQLLMSIQSFHPHN
jgi:hypothetical protein